MTDSEDRKLASIEDEADRTISRRNFIAGVGGLGLGAIFGGLIVKGLILPDSVIAIPASEGYLLIDTKKCGGCETCMLSCSLVHGGAANPALSRIQITKNPFGKFPDDMEQVQCRQCPAPACVEACPTGALHADTENGGVRTVDAQKCIGCQKCVYACPFTPSRMLWNHEEKHAQKCDLCADTPYWDKTGGPGGKQACVEMCPLRAITFTSETPIQQETGYMVNLRNSHWQWLSLDTTDLGREADFKLPTMPAAPAPAEG